MVSLFHRPAITPRDPGWRPAAPQWLRALSDPPAKLDEDDWPLIEHIRTTGQIASGAIVESDSLYNRPWPLRTSVPESRDASERMNAETRAQIKQEAAQSAERMRLYREQYAERIAQAQQREAERRAEAERRRRERDQQWRTKAEARREYERLRAERRSEQQRRDVEWDKREQELRDQAARAEAKRIMAEFQRKLARVNPGCCGCIPCNGRHTPNYWGTGQPDCW